MSNKLKTWIKALIIFDLSIAYLIWRIEYAYYIILPSFHFAYSELASLNFLRSVRKRGSIILNLFSMYDSK